MPHLISCFVHDHTYNAVGVVIRELVSDILIHREFMDKTPARILIYKDKIISENANSPKLFSKIDLNNNEPFSKTSTIARIFRMIGYADEVGSGFEKIKNICEEFLKSKPTIEDKDIFKVDISLINENKLQVDENLNKEKIINYIITNGKINNQEGRKLLNLEKTQVTNLLNELIKELKIYRHGQGKATYYDLNKD